MFSNISIREYGHMALQVVWQNVTSFNNTGFALPLILGHFIWVIVILAIGALSAGLFVEWWLNVVALLDHKRNPHNRNAY